MVLPQPLGLLTTSKGNAAKPDASCTNQELDDEQGGGDQAKGLRNEIDSQHAVRGEGARTACHVVK